jgi:hypothetical protein
MCGTIKELVMKRVGMIFLLSSVFSINAFALEVKTLEACAKKQAISSGYHVAGMIKYEENYFDIRLEKEPGSKVSIRDIVAADESMGGGMYDALVSMRTSIKACSKFTGRLDISDFDGAAIVKDR